MLVDLSFPDFPVDCMDIDWDKRACRIHVKGAFAITSDVPAGEMLGPGIFSVGEWTSLLVRRFDASTETWSESTHEECGGLNEINEFDMTELSVELRGFSRLTGDWSVYSFETPRQVHYSV